MCRWTYAPGSLPAPSLWPDRPLLFQRADTPHHLLAAAGELAADGVLRLGRAEPIETALFVGHVLFRLPETAGTEAYWKQSSSGTRRNSVVIQGRFKLRLPFASVVTGQEVGGGSVLSRLPFGLGFLSVCSWSKIGSN